MKVATTTRLLAAVATLSLITVACSDDKKDSGSSAAPTTEAVSETTGADPSAPTTAAPSPYEGDLVGTFALDAGDCTGTAPAGSYFQMVQPNGTPEAGPFVPNADSTCGDKNFSSLTAGTDGGLVTGASQVAPDPAFDATGNGLAANITQPVKFFGVAFAVAIDSAGPAPTISATDGKLTGDLSAFTAYYGTGIFNQGAPKPDGSGTAPTGTIDPATGHFVLTWSSLIKGGSFDGFTGVWHLEGTFTPKG